MTECNFAAAALPETGTLVVLVGPDNALPTALPDALRRQAERALRAQGGLKRGKRAALLAPGEGEGGLDRLMLFGLGEVSERADPLGREKLGAALLIALRGAETEHASVLVHEGGVEMALDLAAGAVLRGYRFKDYRKGEATEGNREDEAQTPKTLHLTFLLDAHEAAQGSWQAQRRPVLEGVLHARDLVTMPANKLNPTTFAEECARLSDLGVEVEILHRAQLSEIGMGALLAVNQGSAQEPKVAVMVWRGGAETEAPIALIGKGVCFDSGGLSLKPAGSMEDMKWDMAGAGAVFGAMKAIAGRKAKANVVALLGLVENMPSGTAQRPGDVVTSLSGQTIEVLNTDAEGRLVLADVITYARDRFKPKLLVDLATLTGAVIVALGHEHAGLFASDNELAQRLSAAGEAVGDTLWRLPLGKAYSEHIRSPIADMKNTGRARQAGATAGAVFLQRFVGDTPWAHLDIAGTAWRSGDTALAPKGASGFGVRLLDHFVRTVHEPA